MELHPFLERDQIPVPGLWYVLAAQGQHPTMRMGHTSTYVQGLKHGKLYVVGGANPDGPFGDVNVLHLSTMSWDTVETKGLRPRYEHAAFSPSSEPARLYVFGGAQQTGNFNDVQMLELPDEVADGASSTEEIQWISVQCSGRAPSPRTHHASAACGDKLYIYSGGMRGTEPVTDRQLHCFDASNHTWSTVSLRGNMPKPRLGHAMTVVGEERLVLHGGMSGHTFYHDLHVFDLKNGTVSEVKQKRGFPASRTAHSAVSFGPSSFYIFGGMNQEGALDDLWKYDLDERRWTKMTADVPPPACRLNFGMCVMFVLNPTLLTPRDELDSSQQAAELTLQKIRQMKIDEEAENSDEADVTLDADTFPEPDAPCLPPSLPNNPPGPTGDSGGLPDESSATAQATTSTSKDEGKEAGACSLAASNGNAPEDSQRQYPMILVCGGADTQGEWFDDLMAIMA